MDLMQLILAFCVCGSTAAVHSGDVNSSPTWGKFFYSIIFNLHYKVTVTNTELQDIN